ncbi:hydrolase [Shewanella goraebulensis]|uniref:hydrolase n=1 Tax=Shewanella goraebulensis TaxID=3050637 RepID=UPI00255147C3|nr:hydrolase [Shewanella goraebulensis]
MKKLFSPPWWAASAHIQTILPVFFKVDKPAVSRQRQELPDGDFIDLDWVGEAINGQAILVILHGLEGSSDSHYVRRMLQTAKDNNLCAVVHHHRSCSGEPNRLARSYHSGDTQDIHFTLTQLKQQYLDSPLYAVGYSLGGNVLAKYQGEQGSNSLLEKTIIVSAPLCLAACAKKLENGFSTVYQQHLIKQLQGKMQAKVAEAQLKSDMPVTAKEIDNLTTFHLFDDKVTAPLHGFSDVFDYYTRASGKPFLKHVKKSTLVIHAQDDPFMTDAVIPSNAELSEHVQYELHKNGGHVGFISGGVPWKPTFYLESRIIQFIKS